jgi:hypothetical protein
MVEIMYSGITQILSEKFHEKMLIQHWSLELKIYLLPIYYWPSLKMNSRE